MNHRHIKDAPVRLVNIPGYIITETLNMRSIFRNSRFTRPALATAVLMIHAGASFADTTKITLSGNEETPPVTTTASGKGAITVNADKSVSGSVKTSGVAGTAAHIHLGAPGEQGPPIITLTKISDNEWSVPADSKLTDEQYASYKAGKLYVNIHSAEHKGGEIRAQLQP